ncbi:MAG: chitobiase/beta-hexosaminidase C-terminal domain-containing protein, partial [Actinobacteria bacterium]|nr:chitobiase/beta-hexosaminidase C-terminal domain-containing protein [Actinomycetota bacterium]
MSFESSRSRWTLATLAVAFVVAQVLAGAPDTVRAELSPTDTWTYVGSVADGASAYPEALAIDGAGNRYLTSSDYANPNAVVQYDSILKFSPTDPATPVGEWGSFGSGTNPPQFDWPAGIAVDSTGRMIVADTDNSRIMILAPNGTYADSFGTAGSGIGALNWPMGVAVDSSDNIYVADTFNGRIQVFTSTGGYVTETTLPLASPRPDGICLDSASNIYVADANNSVVYKYASMGAGVMPTLSLVGTLNPQGVSVDANGTIFVADTLNSRIAVYNAAGTYVTAFGGAGSAHGQLSYPEDVVARSDGHVFVADTGNDRIEEFVYTPDVTDVTPPVTTSNIPVNWRKAPFQVSLTASDTGSPVSATYYSTDGNTPETLYSNPGFTVGAEGTTTVKYYSVDAKSNIETITTEQLRLDSTPPSTTTDALAQYIGSASFKLYPTDSLSGIATTWFKLNNGQATLGTDLTIGVAGLHKLEFWSEDTATNMETVQTRWINILPVDDDPPVSSVNFDFQWRTQPTTVTISATDIVAGVSATKYSLTKAPA